MCGDSLLVKLVPLNWILLRLFTCKETIQKVSDIKSSLWRRLLFLPEWFYTRRLWKYSAKKNRLNSWWKCYFTKKRAQPLKCTAAETVTATVFSENFGSRSAALTTSESWDSYNRSLVTIFSTFPSVWIFEPQRAKREQFSLIVDSCRFIMERTGLLFNRVMHDLGCLENTRKVSIVLETPRAKEWVRSCLKASFALSNVRWAVKHLLWY